MSDSHPRNPSRRDALRAGVFAAGALALGRKPLEAYAVELERTIRSSQSLPLITKAIPSSGEQIPVVGIGTNAFGNVSAEQKEGLRAVLRRLPEIGGKVVDTAYGYGGSEAMIGELVADIGNRDKLFVVTKFSGPGNSAQTGISQHTQSLERLRMQKVDGLLVHNLNGVEALMPVLAEWKKEGKIRYYGISTSNAGQYAALAEHMRRYPLDIIQVDYSIGNRNAEELILPLAKERGIGVMINVPFGGRSRAGATFSSLADVALPAWAADFDAKSWAQVLLKYVVSHPSVTVAIPGTRQVAHLEDNHNASRGRLPDEAMRKRIEAFWDALPG